MSEYLHFVTTAAVTGCALLATPAVAADALVPLDIRQVRVGGEIGRRIDVTVRNNVLVIDVDGVFLAPFREPTATSGYVGLGKLIDSTSRFAAYTQDKAVLALRRRLVDAAIRCQAPDGYLGIFAPEKRFWTLWDVHEMSYIVYGLVTDARLFDNKPALAAAKRLGDYIVSRFEAEPNRFAAECDIAPHVALTGLEQALLQLSEETGDRKYGDFVVDYRRLPEWEWPLRLGRSADIGNHAYGYLCRCVAQLRLYRTAPDERLLARSRDLMEFLTRGNGMVITGTCGDHECWHNTQSGTINVGETCTTAYLIRWLDAQLRLSGDARLGDLMERAIYNALFAAQSPDGRRIRYYTPFDGGRQYFPRDTYCCPNNYRRIVADLPAMIYYRARDGVLVNLYAESQAAVDLGNGTSLKIRQETDYPTSGKVTVHLSPSRAARFAVKLRIPRWCGRATASVHRDGEIETLGTSGGQQLSIEREWHAGNRIELNMPMAPRLVKGRVNQAGRFALMYGPTVFCLNPKTDPALANMDLRLLAAYPPSLAGPVKDETVRPNGLAFALKAWAPGAWYPAGEPTVALRLTEFPDPDGMATYFFTPNPGDPLFVDDELVTP
jgi:DUF1680 family protein